ncbi:MAG: choice-of-anchor D domain-containing protein [Candidatus Acidiferrales bacterium]
MAPEATPSSISFGNVLAGVNYAQTLVLSNIGSANLTLTQIVASGSGFGVAGLSLPLTLLAGQSAYAAITFESPTFGGASGTVTITSNAAGSPTTVGLSATVGPSAVQLSANPASITFATTTVGVALSQNVVLTNSGNSTLSISSITAGGPGFSVSGGSSVTLAPNQSVDVMVSFDPTTPGFATGSVVVASNAPQLQIPLSGTGVAAGTPSVSLNWSPSPSVVVGYYVYRGTGANAQLSKLTGEIDQSLSYQDFGVASGQTYTYAVTAVDAAGVESVLSTTATVSIP